MMMGIIAGFPAGDAVLTSANSINDYGFSIGGFSLPELGAINPAGLLVVPGAEPAPGTAGEVLELVWGSSSHPSYPQSLFLRIRGSYANAGAVPFTSMQIDGTVFAKAGALFGTGTGNIAFTFTGVTANPLPVGNHRLKFS